MITEVTKGVKISVSTEYLNEYSSPMQHHYVFAYNVTIENQSKDVVQLDSRYWKIKDALNNIEIVRGDGVIGLKPVIQPGESHTYNSGCLLTSPFGSMHGYYNMVNFSTSKKFKVYIPSFKLSASFALN